MERGNRQPPISVQVVAIPTWIKFESVKVLIEATMGQRLLYQLNRSLPMETQLCWFKQVIGMGQAQVLPLVLVAQFQ